MTGISRSGLKVRIIAANPSKKSRLPSALSSQDGKDERRRLAAFGPKGGPIDKIQADTSFQY